MAGIPLVISGSALKMIPSIPGVSVSTELLRRLEDSNDIRKEGLRLAEEIIDDLWDVKGIRGFHLMLFGKGTDEIKALAEYIRKKDK